MVVFMVCKPYLNKTAKKPKSLKPILCLASDCRGPGRLSAGIRTGWGWRVEGPTRRMAWPGRKVGFGREGRVHKQAALRGGSQFGS